VSNIHARGLFGILTTLLLMGSAAATPAALNDGDMAVTLLGTGDPIPSATRNGPSILVEAGGLKLVFDAGRGSTVRLNQLGIWPGQIDAIFITHFHSDHLNGLPDLWTLGYIGRPDVRRARPLEISGPTGIKRITDAMRDAFADDVKIRITDEKVAPAGTEIVAHEFAGDGVMFERNGVKVTAFAVNHGEFIHPAYGYRVDFNGHSVLLSGDTRFDENLIAHGAGLDLLVHEVAVAPTAMLEQPSVKAVLGHHTAPEEAGVVFSRTKPKLAVFSHITLIRDANNPPVSDGEIAKRAHTNWSGALLVGEDLMRFIIGTSGVSIQKHGP
jgi:ribonuclease Z